VKKRMTGKQRLTAALKGEPVDRVPIWLREGFPIGEPFPQEGDFSRGWMHQEVYQELFDYVSPYVDAIRGWSCCGWANRFLMIPPNRIHTKESMVDANTERIEGTVDTPRGQLTFLRKRKRGDNTSWDVKDLVESLEDLKKLAEVPFDFDPSDIQPSIDSYRRAHEEVSDKGVLRLFLSSPMVAISGCMSFEMFLMLSLTEKALFHELIEEITRRNILLIDALFKDRSLDTTVTFGGSEQCTPPMMSPEGYDEFVVPYDGQLVARLKEYGILVQCHCHGRVRHALQCMIDMGYDATDPVEPPPAGDVTYIEAREITDGRITLMGNLEFDELCFADPADIRNRVKEILKLGKDRLILAASAGPTSPITPRVADNYRAWIDTALEFG